MTGLDHGTIGRAIGRSTAQVKTARRAAQVPADISQQAADYPLTLDQLAILADHQDNPASIAALLDAAPRGQMDHVVAQIRAQQAEDAAVSAAVGPVCVDLATRCIPVLEDEPDTHAPGGARSVEDLTIDDDNGGQVQLTAESHAACPGHAAYVAAEYYPADPDDDQPEEVDVTVLYVCTDPAQYGHTSRRWSDRHHTPRPRSTDLEPAEGDTASDAAARLAREQEAEAEAKKVERRELIARNKQVAAQDVRRDFIRTALGSKKHAKTIAAWALERVIHRDHTVARWMGEWSSPKAIGELLGTEQPDQVCREAPAIRHGVLLWVQVVSAYEAEWRKDVWRGSDRTRANYLAHLVSIGYTPCPTEQLMIDRLIEGNAETPDAQYESGADEADELD